MSSENLVFLCQFGGKILNSRLGLVVLFIIYTASPWGLGPKVDEIRMNTAMLKQIQDMEIRNSERLAQLVERCKLIERRGN